MRTGTARPPRRWGLTAAVAAVCLVATAVLAGPAVANPPDPDRPDIELSATASVDRPFTWSIEKTADVSELTLEPGQTATVNYTITASVVEEPTGYSVYGDVFVYNKENQAVTVSAVTVNISGVGPANVTCLPLTLPLPRSLNSGSQMRCRYSLPLPDNSNRVATATAHVDSSTFQATKLIDFVNAPVDNRIDQCIEVYDSWAGPLGQICVNKVNKTVKYGRDIGPFDCGEHDVVNTAWFVTNETETIGSSSWTVKVKVPCPRADIHIEKYTLVEDADPAPGNACPTLGKPVALTFEYVGTNAGPGLPYDDQGGKVSVTGNPNGASPVTVADAAGKDPLTVTPSAVVALDGTFTVSGKWKADTSLKLSWSGGSSTIKFHTSCSKPIRLGDQYGSIRLVGYNGTSGSAVLPPPAPPGFGEDADTPTGPEAVVGDTVVWTYVVTNPGDVPLSNVAVKDDNGTPGNPADDFLAMPVLGPDNVHNVGDANLNGLLDPGEEWLFRASGEAKLGQYGNIGAVTGRAPNGDEVSDDDPSHYFGIFPAGNICATLGKPVALTFRYTGDQFPTSHSQGTKVVVTGTTGNASPVTIASSGKTVTPSSVALNGTFTMNGGKWGADTTVSVSFPGGSQTIKFHTSCSKPIELGDQYGSLQLIGYTGAKGSFPAP
jgi:hypothetical protein